MLEVNRLVGVFCRREWSRVTGGLLLVLLLFYCTGCLERVEMISIHRDGSVDLRSDFSTDSRDEFTNGDAVPAAGSGWDVTKRSVVADDGKTKYEITAVKRVGIGEKMPSTYGRRGDPDRDLFLQFPTVLIVEQRGSDRYYHFVRTYQPREYAQVMGKVDVINERIQKMIAQAKGDNVDMDEKDLPVDVKRRLAELYVQSSLERLETFARGAFLKTNPNSLPDVWLAAHGALVDFRSQINYPELMSEIDRVQDKEDGRLLKQLEDDFESAAIDRIQRALRGTGRMGDLGAFLDQYEENKTAFHITEDLGDDSFEIRLEMPGEIVGSNADERFGNTLVWKFSGKMLNDRRIEVLASSRIARY